MRGMLEIVLEVGDLERAVAFYRDVLGCREVERWPAPRRAVWLDIGRHAVLGLWPASSGGPGVGIHGARGGSHVHFAIYVERGTIEEWRRKLDAAGLEVEGPVEFSGGNRSLFVTDPDGNVVELGDWQVDWAHEPTGD